MKEIQYVITDEQGIHARPAGRLVKEAESFECKIEIGTPAKMVNAKRIMGVMGLALKNGNALTMTFDGPDEEEAAKAMEAFLKDNL